MHMKSDVAVTLRITLIDPPADARWAVQLGRDALLPPVSSTAGRVVFDVPVVLGPNARGVVQLRGAAVQGPPAGRFVYVNSGRRAGDVWSTWDRRAKVPLGSINASALLQADGPVVLDATIHGTARDGGPACASVPLLDGGWKLSVRTG
jgi:hypothetical protein